MRILTSREQLLPLVCEWVELLAQDKYEEAFDLLHHPQNEVWTPVLLRQLVANYGTLEPAPDGRVTSIASAVLPSDRKVVYEDVDWFDEKQPTRKHPSVVWVHFDVPLNGEWSDLTAIFNVIAHGPNYFLQLEDMHVL